MADRPAPARRIDWTGIGFAVVLTVVIIFPLLVVGTWAFTNVWRYPGHHPAAVRPALLEPDAGAARRLERDHH